ncbi:hypothetical protein BDR26DRAFT_852470 [Obelidium mucronatum]|nr:hypothetical protein BDR26DRAFT_852470 [Obelidium mucronatum]
MIHQPVGVDMIQAQVTTAGHLSSSSNSNNSSGISSIASSTSSSRLVDHHHQDPAMAVNTTATQQEQLETPSTDFETMRRELKALPSLQFNAHVDELVDTRMQLDGLTQDQDKQQCVLRLVALKHKLLDSCSIMERKRVLEIIEWFRYRNNNVSVNLTSNDRIQQIMDSTDNHHRHHHQQQHQESVHQSSFNPSVVSAFRDSLLAIPSLHQSIDLIDAFVKCFWEQNSSNNHNNSSTTNKERTSEESRDHALVVMEMTRRLAKQCSGQDLAAVSFLKRKRTKRKVELRY